MALAEIINNMKSSSDLEAGDIRQNGSGSDLQVVLPGGDQGIAKNTLTPGLSTRYRKMVVVRDKITLHSDIGADLLEVIMVIVTVNIGEIKILRTLIL